MGHEVADAGYRGMGVILPAWLADDAARAADLGALARAYKPSRGEINLREVNAWFEAWERVAVFRQAAARPGVFVSVGLTGMIVERSP